MTVPCKGCKSRNAECHSDCRKYIEWRREEEKEKEIIRRKQELEYVIRKRV